VVPSGRKSSVVATSKGFSSSGVFSKFLRASVVQEPLSVVDQDGSAIVAGSAVV
jgi:hypothetical protein